MRYEYIDYHSFTLATTLIMPDFIFPERQEDCFVELSLQEALAKFSEYGSNILDKIMAEREFWQQNYHSLSYIDQKRLCGEDGLPFDAEDFQTVLKELQEARAEFVFVSPKVRAAFFTLSTN